MECFFYLFPFFLIRHGVYLDRKENYCPQTSPVSVLESGLTNIRESVMISSLYYFLFLSKGVLKPFPSKSELFKHSVYLYGPIYIYL